MTETRRNVYRSLIVLLTVPNVLNVFRVIELPSLGPAVICALTTLLFVRVVTDNSHQGDQ